MPYQIQHNTTTHYPALDGLRGLSLCAILLHHNFNYHGIFEIFWISVDIFFALSGFLITDLLLKKREGKNFLANFYTRRLLRIFPLYYISLFLFFYIIPAIIKYPFNIGLFLKNQIWFWTYLQNWFIIFNYEHNNGFLDHFWTLAIEEQFYIIWPCIILLLRSIQKITTFLLASMLIIFTARITIWCFQFDQLNYAALYKFTRVDGLLIGSLLALVRIDNSFFLRLIDKLLISALLFSAGIILPILKILFHFKLAYTACCIYPFVGLLGGFAVNFTLNGKNFLYNLLTQPYLRFIGKISYGLYIFHWPIYKLLMGKFSTPLQPGGSTFFTSFLIPLSSTILTLIAAIISYYCIESPFLKLKKYFT
ncbi:MAG TPA: acyltransferase [Puia sp.]|nr:acyltransferase [Puia sp.]